MMVNPQCKLHEMMRHKDWVIRLAAAQQVEFDRLPEMIEDPSPSVCQQVAKRIAVSYLPCMAMREDPMLRFQVAKRIEVRFLSSMLIRETDPGVIAILLARFRE